MIPTTYTNSGDAGSSIVVPSIASSSTHSMIASGQTTNQ